MSIQIFLMKEIIFQFESTCNYTIIFFLNIILLIYSDSTLIQIGWTFEFTFLNGNFSDLWRQIKKMKKKKTNIFFNSQTKFSSLNCVEIFFHFFVFTAMLFQNIADHNSYFLFCLWITMTTGLMSHLVVMWTHW